MIRSLSLTLLCCMWLIGCRGRTGAQDLIWPNIGFNDYHGPLGAKVVALTFDDGPDPMVDGHAHTQEVLDVLRDHNIKATFFVCGALHTTVQKDPNAQKMIRRMVREGHDLGSHTYTHRRLTTLGDQEVAQEFDRNTEAMRAIFGPHFAFSLYRIPFGFPFQTNHACTGWLGALTATYGVHVGWGMDTDDWKCAQNGKGSACLIDNLRAQLDEGHSGPLLMHSIYGLTAKTLPAIIELLSSRGFRFVTTEQLVADKYHLSSQQVRAAQQRSGADRAAVAAAATRACGKNQPIMVPY